MNRAVPASLALVVVALASSMAAATTMLSLSTERLVSAADVVAVVDVQQVRSSWHGSHIITTEVQVRISEAIKGSNQDKILAIQVPGGHAGGYGQRVEGAPEFVAGQSYVVFLRKNPSGGHEVVGMEQGALALQRDTAGQRVVRRATTAQLVRRTANGLTEAPPPPEIEPADAYLARLRALAGALP